MTRLAKAMSAFTPGRGAQSAGRDARSFAGRGASLPADGSSAPSQRASRTAARFALLPALAALALTALAPSSALAADKAINGAFAPIFPQAEATGGRMTTPGGIAVNQSDGKTYITDSNINNSRVSVFDNTGEFLRAFGKDVVESGQGDKGSDFEICVAADEDVCKRGTNFEPRVGGVMGIPRGVALDALGNVYVSDQSNLRVQKFDPDGNFLLAFGRDVVASGPGNDGIGEVQTVTVRGTSGTFALGFGGQSTDPLDWDAGAGEIEAALNELSTIGGAGGEVSVTGPVGNTFTIVFGGDLLGVDVAQISIDSSGLGTPVGTELTCEITATNKATEAIQWLRNSVPIDGETAATYTAVAADEGKAIQCRGTAFNANGFGSVQASDPATVISPVPTPSPPVPPSGNIASPSPTNPNVGTPLECNPNENNWTGVTEPFAYQWYKSGTPIEGAIGSTYQLVEGDVPGVFQCAVTGSNASGSATTKFSQNRITAGGVAAVPAGNTGSPNIAVTHPFLSSSSTLSAGAAVHEICVADEDVCQAGIAGSAGGEFATTFSGYLAIVPAGAPNAGNLLVADPGNRRVQEFTPAGAFVRAFGWDVQGVDEQQRVTVGATGGTFRLCKDAGLTECTANINFNATGTQVASALAAPAMFGAGNVAGAGTAAQPKVITFQGSLAGTDIDQLVPDPAGLSGGAAEVVVETLQDGAGGNVTTFEVCGSAPICKIAAAAGSGEGQFANNTPSRVAADTGGNIYTVEQATNFRVQKFTLPLNVVTPQGTFAEGLLKGTAASSAPFDVAIDPSNQNVLVTKAFPPGSTASCPVSEAPSAQERRVVEVSAAGAHEGTYLTCEGINTINATTVRGSTGDVFASSTGATGASPPNLAIYALNTPLVPPTVGFQGVTDISANSATVSGFVNPNGPEGIPYVSTFYHFAYKRSSDPTFDNELPAAGNDIGRGTTNQLVSVKLPALEAGTSYDVRLVATKPFSGTASTETFTFSTPAAKPDVGIPSATVAATEGGEVRATLFGTVNPNSKATTYRFEYGETDSYGTKVPVPDASVGAGAADVPVSQLIEGLEPDTTYHFRLVAKNVNGVVASADRTFTTPPAAAPGDCPNEAIRGQQGATHLPDCRAYELVSPADKGPSGSVAQFQALVHQPWNQAAVDGGAMLYPIQNGIPDSTAGGWTRWRAERIEGQGWLQQQVSGPSLIDPPREDGNLFAIPSVVWWASPDLGCAVLQSYNPLTPDTPPQSIEEGVFNLYVWSAADGGYELITNQIPSNPGIVTQSAPFYGQVEAADDCSRVYFRSAFNFFAGASGLYEWDDGTLRDAGVLPGGAVGASMRIRPDVGVNVSVPQAGAVLGGEIDFVGTARWNAVSPDGSRLFFTARANQGPSNGTPAVFMRENGGDSVVEISASQTAVPTNGARFEAASPDGSRVFFRANYGIAGTSSQGPTDQRCGPRGAPGDTQETAFPASDPPIEQKACDLYAYDVETGELTDLSADTNPADPFGAQIQGMVAVDEDGSHAYFAALGQLIPGKGRTYAQNVAGGGSANLYLAHDGELSYVATLERGLSGDLLGGSTADGNGALMRRTPKWSAEASADGGRLIFESSANLTGHDNGGGKAVYLYSADTGGLACLSCPPEGQATVVAPNGRLLAQPRWQYLTHRPRSMSEDGSRVFFTSRDPLAPGAVAGKRNVYQWQEGQVRFLAVVEPSDANGFGEYFDAGASGDDVFIATSGQLVPEDKDFVSDVYNVRVEGGFPFAEPPPECQVDEAVPLEPNQTYCQPDPSTAPGAVDPASTDFFGSGNPGPEGQPASRCNRQQVRRGKRCVAKRALARRACAKRRGKAKRRCVANRMRRLNRVQRSQQRRQGRTANANRGGAK